MWVPEAGLPIPQLFRSGTIVEHLHFITRREEAQYARGLLALHRVGAFFGLSIF